MEKPHGPDHDARLGAGRLSGQDGRPRHGRVYVFGRRPLVGLGLPWRRGSRAAFVPRPQDRGRAGRALFITLLLEAGAEFVSGPLREIGELFAKADLIFSRRRSPDEERSLINKGAASNHSILAMTVH